MCLSQAHNPMTPVRLEPATPQCCIKHSTTEPLHTYLTPNVKHPVPWAETPQTNNQILYNELFGTI